MLPLQRFDSITLYSIRPTVFSVHSVQNIPTHMFCCGSWKYAWNYTAVAENVDE